METIKSARSKWSRGQITTWDSIERSYSDENDPSMVEGIKEPKGSGENVQERGEGGSRNSRSGWQRLLRHTALGFSRSITLVSSFRIDIQRLRFKFLGLGIKCWKGLKVGDGGTGVLPYGKPTRSLSLGNPRERSELLSFQICHIYIYMYMYTFFLLFLLILVIFNAKSLLKEW